MDLMRVDVKCPDCNGLGYTIEQDDYELVCRSCWGNQTVKGYSLSQQLWILDQLASGQVLQYDDGRDMCWVDVCERTLTYIMQNSHRYVLRIKPHILDDTWLPCDVTIGDRVVAKDSSMRQLQDAINAALSK